MHRLVKWVRAAMVAALLVAPGAPGSAQPVNAADSAGRVLVMPFENTGRDRRYFWLGEAAGIVLADALTARGVDAIPREERRAAFDRLQVPATAVLTDATTFRIAQLVGATHVLVGEFQVEGTTLTVRTRAIGVEAGVLRGAVAQGGPLGEFFSIFDALSEQAVRVTGLPARPSSGSGGLATASGVAPTLRSGAVPPSVGVLESYTKGVLAEDPRTASRYLDTALQEAPGYDPARLALWTVYTNQGEHERALRVVSGVRAESAFFGRAIFLSGLSHLAAGQAVAAADVFDRIVAAGGAPGAVNNAGVARLRRAFPSATDALPFFRRAHDAAPDDVDYLFNLGYATWLGRDATGAVRWLREAVRRSPTDGDAHFLLGLALADAGEAAEAARERELARRLSSAYEDWDKGTGPERAPKGVERVKGSVDLPRGGGIDEALAVTGQRDQRELARFYLDRARRAFDRGSDRDAATDLERALYHAPYDADAHLLMGKIHARGGRLPDAVSALKIALWSAESADAHVALAEVLLRLDQREAARAEVDRALLLTPDHAGARGLRPQLAAP